jgi:hypothetical protein
LRFNARFEAIILSLSKEATIMVSLSPFGKLRVIRLLDDHGEPVEP